MKKALYMFTACALMLFFMSGCSKKLPSLEEETIESEAEKNIYNTIYFGEIDTLNYLRTDTEVDYALCSNFVDI